MTLEDTTCNFLSGSRDGCIPGKVGVSRNCAKCFLVTCKSRVRFQAQETEFLTCGTAWWHGGSLHKIVTCVPGLHSLNAVTSNLHNHQERSHSGLREVLTCTLGCVIWLPKEDLGNFWTRRQQRFRLPSSHYSEPKLEKIVYDDFYHVRTTKI